MADKRIDSVVVTGGGTAGWMVAASLARFLGSQTTITLVESDEIGTVGVGEATIPQLKLFNAGLGIDEDEFVRETGATFKLGIEFDGWRTPGERYLHAFGTIGRGLGLLPFHHYWLKHRALGGAVSLWDCSASAQAAGADRFARPVERPGGLPSGLNYAFHFDAGLYAAFLRRYAERAGVRRVEGRIGDVALRSEDGFLEAVVLEDGSRIAGDFFVDCSGFRGLLIEQALASGFDDWSRWLPCDSALAVPSARTDPLLPYTRATARDAGWQWRIPLQHRTGNGYVFCGAHVSVDEATETLLANLDGKALGDPRLLRFTTGKRTRAWVKNCVAIGLSAGFMEPLESTSIHLVQSGIARLLQLFPTRGIDASDSAEFNRQTDFEWEAVRDFLILHYHANARPGAFWQACRDMEIPDRLTHRIALFRASGKLVREHEELFTEIGWLQVMLGQGIDPVDYHPLADQLPAADVHEFIGLAARHAANGVAAMPTHADFIRRHCPATISLGEAA
ncbi:MAG: tryptophan halogenase family protein [Sphingomonas sp.]